MTIKTWTGAAGQNSCYKMVFLDPYLYAALGTHPAQVVKIEPSTMSTIASWTAPAGQSVTFELESDGTYLYAGLQTSPARIVKIKPTDMSTVSTWIGAVGQNFSGGLTFDGNHIFIATITLPGKVIKIDPSTMTTVAIWTGIGEQNYCYGLANLSSFLYVGFHTSPAQVVKIHPSTMTTVAIWIGSASQKYAYSLTAKKSSIYVGLWTSPAQIVKIKASDMTTHLIWTGATGQDYCGALTFNETYLCAGLSTAPAQLVRVDSSSMSTFSIWAASSGQDFSRSVIFDELFTYIGLDTTPAVIIGILGDAELADRFPQHVRLFLGVRLGNTLWSGYVNQSTFEAGLFDIVYDGASGDPGVLWYDTPYLVLREPPSDVAPGVEKGFVQIMSVTVFSETEGEWSIFPKALAWEDNDYLEIRDYIPFYAQPTGHTSDWNWACPVPIMGPHRMGFVDENLEGGFIGEDSYARKGRSIVSYHWKFNGGIVVGAAPPVDESTDSGTRSNPLEVYWTSPGEYKVELTVTDSEGRAFTSYRSILIYERTGENAPYDAFRLSSLTGDWESGGFTCSIEVYESPNLANFPDHALVIILAEEWYGDYKAALGDELGAENQLFVGYIVAGSQVLDAQTETVTLQLATADYLMDRLNIWQEEFRDTEDWIPFYGYPNLTLDDAAFHILEQHTSLREILDIHCDITDRLDEIIIYEGSLFSLLNDQIFKVRLGKAVMSRLSNLYIAQDRQFELRAIQEAHPVLMNVFRKQWLDSVDLGEERAADQISQMEIFAFFRDYLPIRSYAPALNPQNPSEGNWGQISSLSEVLIEDINEGDYIAGQALARENIRYARIQIQIANWRALDPARQDYFTLQLKVGDTLRGHDWSGKTLICRGFDWNSGPELFIEGEPVVKGLTGGCVALDPKYAPSQLLSYVAVIAKPALGYLRAFVTTSFDQEEIYWDDFSAGLTESEAYDVAWDPFNKYQVLYIGSLCAIFRWYAALGTEGEWENLLTLSQFRILIGELTGWFAATRIETSERKQGFVAVHCVYSKPGDSYLKSRVLISHDFGTDWEASDPLSYMGNTDQYYPGDPGVQQLSLNDLDSDRHGDGILYATAGMIKVGSAWYSAIYKSTGWSTSFSLVAARLLPSGSEFIHSKGAVHVPYEDNLQGQIVYWAYSGELEGAYPRVLKSIDGGMNWSEYPGGISGTYPQTLHQARVIESDEDNHQRVIVYRSRLKAASGVYLSTDGGFTQVFKEICDGKAGSGAGKGILGAVKIWAVNGTLVAGGESFIRSSADGDEWFEKTGDLETHLGKGFRVLQILPYW